MEREGIDVCQKITNMWPGMNAHKKEEEKGRSSSSYEHRNIIIS